jgi:UDP-glucose 4-epimerase
LNIIVTGGAGFIASHIVDALVAEGHRVAVLDNLSTGKRSHLNAAAQFIQADIISPGAAALFREFKPEAVIHHAAQIDVQTSLKQPLVDAQINILGTVAMLELCRELGVRKFVYASSAAVYGAPQYLPVDERHPLRPLSFYGISKHAPEHYIEAFSALYGIDYTILRYANVYGIRQDPKGEGGVVSIFVDRLLNGRTPVIYGDGEQTRDFIYVKDTVTANLAALRKTGPGLYNISRNEQTTVNELLRTMCGLMDRAFAPEYREPRPGDIVHSRLDNRAAIEELGWKPEYGLYEGLKETCDYYASQWKAGSSGT